MTSARLKSWKAAAAAVNIRVNIASLRGVEASRSTLRVALIKSSVEPLKLIVPKTLSVISNLGHYLFCDRTSVSPICHFINDTFGIALTPRNRRAQRSAYFL